MIGERRGAVPAVSKALELSVVVLLATVLTTVMFGTVMPAYQNAVASEVGDRTLARTATAVRDAVPERRPHRLRRVVDVDVPSRIRGEPYALQATDGALVLDHPDADVGGSLRLALPDGTIVSGGWASDEWTRIRVVGNGALVRVRLVSRERRRGQ